MSPIDGSVEVGANGGLDGIIAQSSEGTPERGTTRFEKFVERSTTLYYEVNECMINIPKLLYRLSKASEVPLSSKLEVGAALVYIVVPIDAIPDFIPYTGWLDDFLVASAAIAHAINRIGKENVLKYWKGSRETFDKMYYLSRRVYDVVEEIVPNFWEKTDIKIGARLFHATLFYGRKFLRFV